MTKISKVAGFKEARELSKIWNEPLTEIAKEHGIKVDNLLAMSPGNDPFKMTEGKILKGAWAKKIMDQKILQHLRAINVDNIHLRDIHYILLGTIRTWNNSAVYQNTEAHWKVLLTAFANARYLKMVDPKLIRDNKNKFYERTTYREDEDFEPRAERGKEDLTKEKVLELFISWYYDLKNYHNHQAVHVEIWAEKDLALLDQVAEKYKINTVIGEGETSLTQVFLLMDRIKKAGKPVRIGYIADCDVVGSNMSKAMARKLEFIIRKMETEGYDVKLVHLMLTPEQVRKYNLPPQPMKDSKSRAYETRKDDWKKSHGITGAVEINSFHALYPGEFRDILENFILSYFDTEQRDQILEFNEEQSDKIKELISNNDTINGHLKEFLEVLVTEIDGVDWDKMLDEYDTEFDDMIWNHGKIEFEENDEYYNWLLNSDLNYGGQLNLYKKYESGELDSMDTMS